MGFGDLFKPKFKHSDWQVRKDAVKKITDEKLLIQIVNNDSSPDVREEAVKQINNQAALKEISNNNDWPIVRVRAFTKIENREEYLKTITDESLLYRIAQYDEDENIRIEAVKRISNVEKLKNIAIHARYPYVKPGIEAAKKITNHDVLREIINYNWTNQLVIQEATKNITDENTLANIEKEKQVKLFREKLLIEKNMCKEDVYNMLISDKEFFYHDCIRIASQLESNGCDILALLAYINEDIKNSGFDDQTAWLNKKNIKYVKDNINRLKDKIGNELLPVENYEIRKFIKKLLNQ